MHECFTRKTVIFGQSKRKSGGNKAKFIREILKEAAKQGKIQREIVKVYQVQLIEIESQRIEKQRAEKVRETVANLSQDDVLSPNAFWKLK